MRLPLRSETETNSSGLAAKRKVDLPKPSGMSSSTCAPESRSMSRPVIPASRVPSPT